MTILPQLLLNGIIAGSVYALIAAGFSLIYSVTKFMHFAHGAVLAMGGYLLFLFTNILGMNFALSVLITLILTSLLGAAINGTVYKQLRKRRASNAILLISSMALLIFFNALILALFGADGKTLKISAYKNVYEFFTLRITTFQLWTILMAFIILIFMYLLIKKTRLGKAMRAVSDNKDVAKVVGINPERIYTYTFLIASFLAAIAGMLIGLDQNLYPTMGIIYVIMGFTAAVVGGINYVPGAVVGGLVVGLVENLGIWVLPTAYKGAIVFTLLFVFLIFRPQGILGKTLER